MSNNGTNVYSQRLPDLQDPSGNRGVFVVKHMLSIISAFLIIFGLCFFCVLSCISIDVTIRASVGFTKACGDRVCVFLNVASDEQEKISINDHVRVVAASGGSENHYSISGKIVSINEKIPNEELLRMRVVKVELEEKFTDGSNIFPLFGLIVVGSESGWQFLFKPIVKKL